MLQLLVPILVFAAVILTGAGIIIAARERRSVTARLLATSGQADLSPEQRRRWLVESIGRFGSALSLGRGSEALRTRMSQAGFYGEAAPTFYLTAKLLLLAIGTLTALAIVLPLDLWLAAKVYFVVLGGAILFFTPNMVLRSRLARRRREVREHLPDAIDLLEVCVSAGMGLDMAWNSVADEIRRVSTVLADEMALTNLEIQLGASRTEALRHLSDRTDTPECASLVALLVQSDRFGTSVAEALGTFATSMRESRSQTAEETAEKMAVKLLFPLVLFIFPVMLIVMTGPTAITLTRILTGG